MVIHRKREVVSEVRPEDEVIRPEVKPMIVRSSWDKFGPFLALVVVVMAFFLGVMYSKVKYLEGGAGVGAGTGAPTANANANAAGSGAKYKTFKDALTAYAKELKLNEKQFVSCVEGGQKADVVSREVQEGTAVGVQGTPGFFVNGRFLGGAFPLELFKEVIDKELAGKGSANIADYSQNLQDAAKSDAFNPVPKNVEVGSSNVQGKSGAKIVVVEFSDFQCPYCSRALPTIRQLMKDYAGNIQLVYKQFPLIQIHPNAQKAAEASECARDQGKFWELHDLLFAKQAEWSSSATI